MGAWGSGIFEDDTAMDCFEELIESDPNDYLDKSFSAAEASTYLEYELCCAVLVSAAVMDGLMHNFVHDKTLDELQTYLSENKQLKLIVSKQKAVDALRKVISNNSELNELWSENETEYPNWKRKIEDIIKRMS